MPKPLSDGQVEYTDGTPATVDQYGRDVAAFLMWAAEPTLDARHRLGFQVMIFLIVLASLLYFHQEEGLARRGALIPPYLHAMSPHHVRRPRSQRS